MIFSILLRFQYPLKRSTLNNRIRSGKNVRALGAMVYLVARVHNIRGREDLEYPTSLVWPNALRKVMT